MFNLRLGYSGEISDAFVWIYSFVDLQHCKIEHHALTVIRVFPFDSENAVLLIFMLDSHNGIHKGKNLEVLVILQAVFLILKFL